jgi:hypothetical protein
MDSPQYLQLIMSSLPHDFYANIPQRGAGCGSLLPYFIPGRPSATLFAAELIAIYF